MMLPYKFLFTMSLLVLVLLSCNYPWQPPTPSATIGSITSIENLVRTGDQNDLQNLNGTRDLLRNDTVQVTDGGAAQLDFENQISIKLYNDSSVSGVSAVVEGASNRIRMKLERGGLSGQIWKGGDPVEVEIANGAHIYILGTQFLITYDAETGVVSVGNFDGTVGYDLPGQPIQFLAAGRIIDIYSNGETQIFELKFPPEYFSEASQRIDKPLQALAILRGVYPGDPIAAPNSTQVVTIAPSFTPNVSITLPSTITATPTPTMTLTFTPSPTASTLPSKCDQVQFIADVTVPDGTIYAPGATFNKTWRLSNIGTCTWTTAYQLVFYSGAQMGRTSSLPFSANVAPGQTVDLSVRLVAPYTSGYYRGYWMFKNSSGALFGVGSLADKPWWVGIQVQAPTISITPPTPTPTITSTAVTGTPPSPTPSP